MEKWSQANDNERVWRNPSPPQFIFHLQISFDEEEPPIYAVPQSRKFEVSVKSIVIDHWIFSTYNVLSELLFQILDPSGSLGRDRKVASSIKYDMLNNLAQARIFVIGVIITSALIIWKALICITGSQSPIVVVLSGSMEPGFKKGDILFLHMNKDPIRAGEIVVYNVEGRPIPIVHRVIKIHERRDAREVDVLTKGDNNPDDDRMLYAHGQLWLQQRHIMGRAMGFLPYLGWVTIIMTEKPIVKYIVIGALGLLAVTSKK